MENLPSSNLAVQGTEASYALHQDLMECFNQSPPSHKAIHDLLGKLSDAEFSNVGDTLETNSDRPRIEMLAKFIVYALNKDLETVLVPLLLKELKGALPQTVLNTALHVAAGSGDALNPIRKLIQLGAEIWSKDEAGNNAAQIAELHKPQSQDVIMYLYVQKTCFDVESALAAGNYSNSQRHYGSKQELDLPISRIYDRL